MIAALVREMQQNACTVSICVVDGVQVIHKNVIIMLCKRKSGPNWD